MYIRYVKDNNFYSYFMAFLSEPMTKKYLFSMNIGSVHFKSFPLWNFSSYTLSIFLYAYLSFYRGLRKGAGGGDMSFPLGEKVSNFFPFLIKSRLRIRIRLVMLICWKSRIRIRSQHQDWKNPFKINPFFEYSLTKAIIRKVFIFQL